MYTRTEMEQYLKTEYNIKNEKELEKAIKEMPKIDISIFTERPQNDNPGV